MSAPIGDVLLMVLCVLTMVLWDAITVLRVLLMVLCGINGVIHTYNGVVWGTGVIYAYSGTNGVMYAHDGAV